MHHFAQAVELRRQEAYGLASKRMVPVVAVIKLPAASVPVRIDSAECSTLVVLHHLVLSVTCCPAGTTTLMSLRSFTLTLSKKSTRRVNVSVEPPVSKRVISYNHVLRDDSQLATSVIGAPLKGTGFGATSVSTWPRGAGAGAGAGAGVGAVTGVDVVGSELSPPPQLLMMSAATQVNTLRMTLAGICTSARFQSRVAIGSNHDDLRPPRRVVTDGFICRCADVYSAVVGSKSCKARTMHRL